MSFKIKNLRRISFSFLFVLSACDVSPILSALLDDDEEEDPYYYGEVTPNVKPVITSLTLTPDTAYSNTSINAVVTATDEDDDDAYLYTSYQWYVNGSPIYSGYTSTLSSDNFVGSDVVKVVATVYDSRDSVEATASVTILNTAPTAFISLPSENIYTNTDLTGSINATDIDNDTLITTYEWSVNNNLIIDETTITLPSSYFVKNDTVTLNATVSDGNESFSTTANTIVQDAAPAISITSAPTTVNYGSLLTFSVTATDVDGDTPIYSIHHGPNGMTVDPDGTVNWTARSPLFTKETDFNWGISAHSSDSGRSVVNGTIKLTDIDRLYPLSRSGINLLNKTNSIIAGNYKNNGTHELLVTDHEKSLYTLIYDGSDYIQDWLYPFDLTDDGHKISSITTFDLDSDGKSEFIIGTDSWPNLSYESKLVILDGNNREELRSFTLVSSTVHDIEVADINGDSIPELILLVGDGSFSNSNKIQVLDISTFDLIWETSSIAVGTTLATADVDNDGKFEIISDGGFVFGYNGTDYVNEWLYGPGFGFKVETGDIDGDGISEIICAENSAVRVFSAVTKSETMTLAFQSIHDMSVGDFNGDNKSDVLLSEGNWIGYNVRAFTYSLTPIPHLSEVWTIDSQGEGASNLQISDIDNDGQMEFIWKTNPEGLIVSGLSPTINIEWMSSNMSFNRGFVGGEWLTLNQDNTKLVFASSLANPIGYNDTTHLVSMDIISGKYSLSNAIYTGFYPILSVSGSDYDLDGTDEIIVSGNGTDSQVLNVYDLFNNTSEWTSTSTTGYSYATSTGLMNNDAYEDIASITYNGDIYIFDPFNSTLLWTVTEAAIGHDIKVADLDNDGTLEIIAAFNDAIRVYSSVDSGYELSHTLELNDASFTTDMDMEVGDLDGDGSTEIIVGYESNTYNKTSIVTVFSSDLSLASSFTVNNVLKALAIENYGNGLKNIILGLTVDDWSYAYSYSYLSVVNPYSGAEVMRSPALSGVPSKNSIHYNDINSDGIPEISYGTTTSMNISR